MSKGDRTRQRILEQAAPLFNQRGLEGTSMQEIMRVTGLEKGGIYRYFESKEHLAIEAVRQSLDTNIRLHLEQMNPADSSLDQLQGAIAFFVRLPSTLPGGCPLMNTAIDADDGNAGLRTLALDSLNRWRAALVRIVQRGKRNGEILPDVEPRAVANTIIAGLEGALMISRLERSDQALRQVGTSLAAMLTTLAA